MTEGQTIAFIASLVGLVAGVLAIWFRIEGRIKSGENAAATRIEASGAHAQLVASQLAEYKTHVAETYVSKAGLREVRDEIMTGVRDLKGSVSSIHSRIDQVMLGTAERRPPAE